MHVQHLVQRVISSANSWLGRLFFTSDVVKFSYNKLDRMRKIKETDLCFKNWWWSCLGKKVGLS